MQKWGPRWQAAGTFIGAADLVGLVALSAFGLAVLPGPGKLDALGNVVVGGSFAGMGLLLVRRRPDNAMGWVFTAAGFVWFLNALTVWPHHLYASGDRHLSAVARLVLAGPGWPLLVVPSLQLPLVLLPDGRPRSARGRVLAIVTVVAMLLTDLPLLFVAGDIQGFPGVRSPLGVVQPHWPLLAVVICGAVTLFGCAVLAVAGLLVTYRRSRGVARQQLRWVALGGVVVVAGLVAGPFTTGLAGALQALGFATPPVTIGLAVLRYRLYDIDRVVSRTVAYALVTALLLAVYTLCVTVASVLSPGSSGLPVAASTLVAAALFHPLRRRVQALVDRRFNRARYDSARVVEAFATNLRAQVDLGTLRADLLAAVQVTLEPATSSLWLAG